MLSQTYNILCSYNLNKLSIFIPYISVGAVVVVILW